MEDRGWRKEDEGQMMEDGEPGATIWGLSPSHPCSPPTSRCQPAAVPALSPRGRQQDLSTSATRSLGSSCCCRRYLNNLPCKSTGTGSDRTVGALGTVRARLGIHQHLALHPGATTLVGLGGTRSVPAASAPSPVQVTRAAGCGLRIKAVNLISYQAAARLGGSLRTRGEILSCFATGVNTE